MMKPKHVLIVGGRDHTLDKALKLGIRYSMIQTPDLVTEKQIKTSTRYVVMDYQDVEEVLLLARTWHAKDPFDAVVSFAEYGMYAGAICATELGLPGVNTDAIVHTRDKIKMRALLEQNNLSTVRYRVCDTVDDARTFFKELDGTPIILKPYAGGGSAGVSLVKAESELHSAWGWTRNATSETILAEEYLEGPEFSVESISLLGWHEIAMVTEKVTTGAPHFIELGHHIPARLDERVLREVKTLVTRFLELIHQQTSPAHTEIKITKTGPKIIESQTRIGGDQIWEMTEMVSGVDLMSETMTTLLDMPLPTRTPTAKAAAVRFFALDNKRIRAIEGLDLARKAKGVIRVTCTLKLEQELGPLEHSDSRQGYALCTGESVDDAIANAEYARGLVRIETGDLQVTTVPLPNGRMVGELDIPPRSGVLERFPVSVPFHGSRSIRGAASSGSATTRWRLPTARSPAS